MLKKIENIESLRGWAAMLVLLSHLPFLTVGGFGVDIFFVISGFIMVYVTRVDQSGFLLKRIARVVPSYWLITIVLAGVVFVKPSLFSSTEFDWVHLIKSLLFIPFDKNGYIEPMLGVGWTLNYEMFFYLIFYISFNLSVKYRTHIASLNLLILVAMGLYMELDSVLWEFYTDPILIEFVFGMLLAEAYLADKVININPWVSMILQLSLVIVLLAFRGKASGDFRVVLWGLPSAALFCFYVLGGSRLFLAGVMSKIGSYSYSLYLTHVFVVLAVHRVMYDMSEFTYFSVFWGVVVVVVSLMLAKVYWYFVEDKSIDMYRRVLNA